MNTIYNNFLQQFKAFFKLSNGTIIDIPTYDDEEFLILSDENIAYFLECYEQGKELTKSGKARIEGQKIEDIYFCYYQEELLDNAYVKLSNGYYITETNYGPPGVTTVDLLILSEKEFLKSTELLNAQIKSYLQEIKSS